MLSKGAIQGFLLLQETYSEPFIVYDASRVLHLQSDTRLTQWLHLDVLPVQSMALCLNVLPGHPLELPLQVAVAQLVDGVVVLQRQLFP